MTRIIKSVLFGLLLGTLFNATAHAATHTAASCSESDVASAVAQASNGDTVIIPSCPSGVSWTTSLTVTKGITIQGQGAGITVLLDNTSKGDSNCQRAVPLIGVSLSSNVPFRVTGLTITGVPPAYNCGESAEHILFTGVSHQVRIDNIIFNLFVAGVNITGDTWGVADHNTFNEPTNENPPFPFGIHHDSWQNVGAYGDNSWAQADTFGQAGAFYIENNTFNYSSTAYFPTGCFDSEEGGRVVFRFNTGCPFVGNHGLDSSGRYRSARSFEIYNNPFVAIVNPNGNMYTGVFLRGGTGMIFNNNFNDVSGSDYVGSLVLVNSYRDTSGYAPWGPSYTAEECDGRGPFDTNTRTVYASFTASSSSTLDRTVASGSPGWTTNQWADGAGITYSLVDTAIGWGSTIVSNTSNTIITSAAAQPGNGAAHTASSGDVMQILASYPCTDQIGRGPGAYISGGNPTPIATVNQASDPTYEWLNSHNGMNQSAISSANFHVQQNRDYYDWTSSFNGTSGVGSGALASRSSTCTVGVAYWATDQGNWNQSGRGGQGELFVCSATNTWTLYYTPYTYPHPLTLGGGSPDPPTNLQAIAH